MRMLRVTAIAILVLLALATAAPALLTSSAYDEQFREDIDCGPSLRFPLGTDELGRDRLARLLYGTRTSLLFAPAAAALAVLLATGSALLTGNRGRATASTFDAVTDLFASLPWLFLLITVRAAMPLDAQPIETALVTYALLASIGWAAPARVLRNAVRSIAAEDYVLQAQAVGTKTARLFPVHVVPNLWPLIASQFLVAIPVFVIGEANLGLLGLGVPEPMPSLGGLLRQLEDAPGIWDKPWVLAPIAVLAAVVGSLHVLSIGKRERTHA